MKHSSGYEEIERLLEVFDFEQADCAARTLNVNGKVKYEKLKQIYEGRFFNSEILPHLTSYNFERAEHIFQSKKLLLSKEYQNKYVAIKKDCLSWQKQ